MFVYTRNVAYSNGFKILKISIIKMILFQNDYVVVDVSHTKVLESEEVSWYIALHFSITLQVNWKIRRTTFTSPLKWEEISNLDWSEKTKTVQVKDYEYIYAPFYMLSCLWYDIPHWVELHPLVTKAIDHYFYNDIY